MCTNREESHLKEPEKSIINTIYETTHDYPGGAKALAEKLKVKAGTFNNKCDPAMPGHTLNINEVRGILKITGDHRLLFEIARELNYVCIDIPNFEGISDVELLNAWADWDAERGETGQAIKKALNDHSITKKELEKIRKEMFEDFEKELALLSRLESIAE